MPQRNSQSQDQAMGSSRPDKRDRSSDARRALDSEPTQFRLHGGTSPPESQREEVFRPVLICLSGELRGQRRPLDSRSLIIGRGSSADWHIDDGITSRTHAQITYENVDDSRSMPRCFVEDLGSRNGTELNGKRIEGPTRLVERDRLLVGSTVIGFYIRDSDELQNEMSLYHSATKDPLTALDNRRQLQATVKTLMGRWRQKNRSMAFLLMDIDHFKMVNDTHGHNIGDQALKHIATVMRQTVRENDTPCRWGGEEFAVVMPSISPRSALRVAENLRRAIESQPLMIDHLELPLTVSIGITLSTSNDSMDSIFQRADQLLYRAKQSGRNRVEADEAILVGCLSSQTGHDSSAHVPKRT